MGSFYGQFRHRPVGEHIIRVCEGTACHVSGSVEIETELRRCLGISGSEDTDPSRQFTLERVGKSGAIFSLEMLSWLNFQHLRRKTDSEVLALVRNALAHSIFKDSAVSDERLLKIIEAMRERSTFVQDFIDNCPYFYTAPGSYDPDVVKKRWKSESPELLQALAEAYGALEHPTKRDYEETLDATATRLGVGRGELIHPLRLTLTGMGVGPGLYEVMDILGHQESLHRIERAIERLTRP